MPVPRARLSLTGAGPESPDAFSRLFRTGSTPGKRRAAAPLTSHYRCGNPRSWEGDAEPRCRGDDDHTFGGGGPPRGEPIFLAGHTLVHDQFHIRSPPMTRPLTPPSWRAPGTVRGRRCPRPPMEGTRR